MYFLSRFLYVCILCQNIIILYGYVLFAANVEDFQRIAKKLGSSKFMDQLTDIANDPTFARFTTKSKTRFERQDGQTDIPIARQREPANSLRFKDDSKIDFEELVERVKQRLEKEFRNKFKSPIREEEISTQGTFPVTPRKQRLKKRIKIKHIAPTITTTMSTIQDYEYETESIIQQTFPSQIEPKGVMEADIYESEIENPVLNTNMKNTSIYYDNVYEYDTQNTTDKEEIMYEKVMLKDDAYGDYVTPQKEINKYASIEKTRYKKVDNRLKITTDKKYTEDNIEYVDEVTIGSREIKARTERLWYDDNNFNDTKIISDERSGTGVPTRQTYKIVTPNYYASLPTVAEKYDFNEPIPEKDREREKLRYIGNPPARINRKIKLMK